MIQPHLYFFGDLLLSQDGAKIPLRTKKQQRWIALLAYLAVKQRPVQRQKLASLIWGDQYDASDRLRKHTLDELKRKIGGELLEVDAESVRLRSECLWIDVTYFRECLNDYRLWASTQSDDQSGLQFLENGLSVYQGDFLGPYSLPESEAFYFWQIDQSATLRQDFSAAVEELIEGLFRQDEMGKALHYASLWKSRDAGSLKAHAWMQVLLERSANKTDAQLYAQQLKPMLRQWQKSEADFNQVRQKVEGRLRELRREKRHLFPPKESQVLKLLSDQLKNAEFDQASDNPDFFEGYVSVLTKVAQRNPLEAVKVAGEIADALFDLKDKPADAKIVLDQVETVIRQKQDQLTDETRFLLLLQRMSIYRALGLTLQVVELIESTAQDRDYIQSLDDGLKAAWYCNVGLIECWVKGDYANALKSLELAKTYFRACGQFKAEAGVTADIGLIYWNQGKLHAAEECLVAAREQAALLGEYRSMLKTIGNLGLIYLYQGKINEAYNTIQDHFQLATHLGHLKEIRRARGNRGIVRFHLGDYGGAIEDLETTIRAVRIPNEGVLHATVNLSRCYSAKGDVEQGRQLAAWALGQGREKQYTNIEIIARRALAECLPPQEARGILREALSLAKGKRYIDEAACLLSLARLTANRSEREAYRQAGVQILREMGAQAWLAADQVQLPTL
jgi:DNA-binding SARP family transcriptional activator